MTRFDDFYRVVDELKKEEGIGGFVITDIIPMGRFIGIVFEGMTYVMINDKWWANVVAAAEQSGTLNREDAERDNKYFGVPVITDPNMAFKLLGEYLKRTSDEYKG